MYKTYTTGQLRIKTVFQNNNIEDSFHAFLFIFLFRVFIKNLKFNSWGVRNIQKPVWQSRSSFQRMPYRYMQIKNFLKFLICILTAQIKWAQCNNSKSLFAVVKSTLYGLKRLLHEIGNRLHGEKMGSFFSKKKEPELEKPKITKQDKEVLVSRNGFQICRRSRASVYINNDDQNFIPGVQHTIVIQLMN